MRASYILGLLILQKLQIFVFIVNVHKQKQTFYNSDYLPD